MERSGQKEPEKVQDNQFEMEALTPMADPGQLNIDYPDFDDQGCKVEAEPEVMEEEPKYGIMDDQELEPPILPDPDAIPELPDLEPADDQNNIN